MSLQARLEDIDIDDDVNEEVEYDLDNDSLPHFVEVT